jgi:hypothetical protein
MFYNREKMMFEDEKDFQKIVNRLNIDSGQNLTHRENLRSRMLSVFNETIQKPQESTIKKILSKNLLIKIAAAVVIIAAITLGLSLLTIEQTPSEPTIEIPDFSAEEIGTPPEEMQEWTAATSQETPEDFNTDMVPIDIELPKALFIGTPQAAIVDNLEKPLGTHRPPFLAPAGTKNVALGKPITASDKFPIIGDLKLITDGDMDSSDGKYVEFINGVQYITVDLGAVYNIYAVVVWHLHKQPFVFFDVIVQTANDSLFIENVNTLFNNDMDNSAGLGIGKDMHYTETNEGKLIDAKGVQGRYVRLYSSGYNLEEFNYYVEVSVYGKVVE